MTHTTADIHSAAAVLGRKGGSSKSPAKRAASRANAKLGGRPRLRYALYCTQFHGGGLISRHKTLDAAEDAQRRYRGTTDCVCGCAVIVDRDRDSEPTPAYEGGSPYRAAK